MDLTTVLSLAGLVVAVPTPFVAMQSIREHSARRSERRFRDVQGLLRADRGALGARCLAEQRRHQADAGVPLLTLPGWVPDEPLPPAMVALELALPGHDEPGDPALLAARERSRVYWPGAGGARHASYSGAIAALDRPGNWKNLRSYRLDRIEVVETSGGAGGPRLRLGFGMARYFDGIDTGEALAYEAALRSLRGKGNLSRGRYRSWLGDPFDLTRRAALLGVNVLTLRRDGDRVTFFLHQRDGDSVATARDVTHVAPAGDFQPQADMRASWLVDLDLWRTVMREYHEEFLGAPDATGSGELVDYEADPFSSFDAALGAGDVEVAFLGLGLDPLSWKHEACLVAVWRADAFDRCFTGMRTANAEGTLLVGRRGRERRYTGMAFDEATVRDYVNRPEMLPAGRACLALAWRSRVALGLAGTAPAVTAGGPGA